MSDIKTAVNNFKTQASELRGAYLERNNEIKLLQVSLISEQPAVLLGPAGVGKSAIVRSFAESVEYTNNNNEIDFYEYLLNRFTTPAELFGAPSISELKNNDRLIINTEGKLPTARIAFLDEIFKCNSATLNSLLTILNEGEFDDGTGVRKAVPLQMCVGASNELPEEDCGLEPLWDRFVLRRWVEDIKSESSFLSLLTGDGIGEVSNNIVSQQDIAVIKDLRDNVDITPLLECFLQIRVKMEELGIRVSGRRWRKVVKVIKSHAALNGRSTAKKSDLPILADLLWDVPEDRPAIVEVLEAFKTNDDESAKRLLDCIQEEMDKMKGVPAKKVTRESRVVKTNLQNILTELKKLDSDYAVQGEQQVAQALKDLSKLVLASLKK